MVRAFLARSWPERWAALEAGVWLVGMRAALGLLPFPTVLRGVERLGGGRRTRGPRIEAPKASDATPSGPATFDPRLDRRLWATETVGHRVIPRGPCLPQALVAHVWLRRAGHPAHLRIGTRMGEGGAVEAHAWVESGGRVVVGDLDDLASYTPMAPSGYRDGATPPPPSAPGR